MGLVKNSSQIAAMGCLKSNADKKACTWKKSNS